MMRSFLLLTAFAIASAAPAAQPMGRLFFTPAERAQLDGARTQKHRAPPVASTKQPEPPPAPQIITYSGIVRRSDGQSILWLNNRPLEEKEALSALAVTGRVGPDGAVTLQVPQTGNSVNLKVGQRAELQTGKVAEGRSSVPPPAKAGATPQKQPENESADRKSDAPAPAGPKTQLGGRTPDSADERRPSGRDTVK